ncbi:MAG TPA: hypothetical protein PKZ41_03270 [Candidatus Omnitrophota bacterium]|nr:hypothetical protein [Candidatus Omnitrophota bacterium]
MFTKEDYAEYMNEIEDLIREAVVVYTDLLNELSDSSIKSKIEPLASESMDSYRYIRSQKEKFV